MNRSEKNGLRKETKCFDASLRLALYSYGEKLDTCKYNEQDKLDRLPNQIRDSSTGDQIQDSIHVLEEISSKIDEIENAIDEILYLADTSSSFSVSSFIKHKVSPGRKGISFHAILPFSVLKQLKSESIKKL